jgi:hypothetical protein
MGYNPMFCKKMTQFRLAGLMPTPIESETRARDALHAWMVNKLGDDAQMMEAMMTTAGNPTGASAVYVEALDALLREWACSLTRSQMERDVLRATETCSRVDELYQRDYVALQAASKAKKIARDAASAARNAAARDAAATPDGPKKRPRPSTPGERPNKRPHPSTPGERPKKRPRPSTPAEKRVTLGHLLDAISAHLDRIRQANADADAAAADVAGPSTATHVARRFPENADDAVFYFKHYMAEYYPDANVIPHALVVSHFTNIIIDEAAQHAEWRFMGMLARDIVSLYR